jgi:hypothetical protein
MRGRLHLVKKYVVKLSPAERARLAEIVAAAATPVRSRRRAMLLLDADSAAGDGGQEDQAIARLRGVSVPTVARVRQLYAVGGVEAVLATPWMVGQRGPGLNADQIARLLALADSPPPAGARRWSLRQLADAMVANQHVGTISHETVRRILREREAGYDHLAGSQPESHGTPNPPDPAGGEAQSG